MKMTVLGTQLQDYVSRKTGQPVKGISLHCAYKDQAVNGQAVDNVYVSDNLDCAQLCYSLAPGSIVDVEYNRRGYVADVRLVEPAPSQSAKK